MNDASIVTVTLFDFTDEENPKRMSVQIPYDPTEPFAPVGPPLKVSIGVGDACVSSTVTLPLATLNLLMGNLMQGYEQSQNSSLVGIKPPKIILPN